MIYQELIIDGVSLDLYDDTDITLEITSNVFNDITEITTNRSYTVSLPKTVRNLTLIGNCDKVGTNTDAPYTFHDCEYRRNGVPIYVMEGRQWKSVRMISRSAYTGGCSRSLKS